MLRRNKSSFAPAKLVSAIVCFFAAGFPLAAQIDTGSIVGHRTRCERRRRFERYFDGNEHRHSDCAHNEE